MNQQGHWHETAPDIELLVCCARTTMEPERAARVEELVQGDIDWERLLDASLWHGTAPLLYWHLNAICPNAVPPPALDRLRDVFELNLRRNWFLTGELVRILEALKSHGVLAIPIKGPTLAASAYSHLGFRRFQDLDLLVRRPDVLKAKETLISLGFQPELDLTPSQMKAYLRSQSEVVMRRSGGGIIVELQWELAPKYFGFPLAPLRLWEHLHSAVDVGFGLSSLPPEDTLLLLCVHGAKHAWEKLIWVCDVAQLVNLHHGIDWSRLMKQARALGGERMLLLGLFLAGDWLDARLPEGVWKRAKADPSVTSLAAQVRQRFVEDVRESPTLWAQCCFHLQARERLKDRVRYSLRLATTTTPGDWAMVDLPRPLAFLYYPLRVLRLLGKYGRSSLSQTGKWVNG